MGETDLDQDRDRWRETAKAVINYSVPYYAGKFWTSTKPVSFSKRTLLHGARMSVCK